MDRPDQRIEEVEPESDRVWLVDVCLDLSRTLPVRVDRCVGDVPVLLTESDQVRLLIGFAVGRVEDLEAQHVGLAEAFALAARKLADEVCELVAQKYSVPGT